MSSLSVSRFGRHLLDQFEEKHWSRSNSQIESHTMRVRRVVTVVYIS